ncbi:MAG: hypothetical protein L0K12_00845 [Brevibacterium aurantiacum]|uniref:DUF6668 family protein n=1 Tax=Brachybacterium alimentarium TaxID=47845 RepID=UPI000DF32E1B|nr:DUF6668 family protein [Brachybacterium alimentarium]MDN6303064.1 hypothetical protein [Brachybacterium sp.]MDN6371468.1 hypothetical protein [Brevibacterium aurantiacum]RCS68763.1 hypothetical protein CIK68_12500 [Brachybacterium alimentarium]
MTELPRNPFLPPPVEVTPEEVVEPDPVLGDEIEVTGPSSPVHAPRIEAKSPTALMGDADADVPTGRVALVGLHGGAGVSTLETLLGDDVVDAGTRMPAVNPYVPGRPRVLLVARTHDRGLSMAEEVTTAWSHRELPDLDVIGLVLVDDGPKLTAAMRQSVSRLLRMTPHGWHIPWVEAWRTSATPSLSGVRLPRTIKSIRRAVGAPESSKGPSS